MKKALYITIIIALLISPFGCSFIKEKETKKPVEIQKDESKEQNDEEEEIIDVWPSNEFTNQVPRFTYGINEQVYSNTEEGFIYGADDVTKDEYNLYKKDLKKAGFKNNINEIVDTITTYTASKDIYEVSLSYVDTSITITIIKENLQQ